MWLCRVLAATAATFLVVCNTTTDHFSLPLTVPAVGAGREGEEARFSEASLAAFLAALPFL